MGNTQDGITEALAILREGKDKSFRGLADRLERLSHQIEAAGNDKRLLRKIRREEMEVRLEFAELLSPDRSGLRVHLGNGKRIVPRYKIAGVPSKKWKDQVKDWMATRTVAWDGSAPILRKEVRKALVYSQSIPDHYFGLHCQWSIVVEKYEPMTELRLFESDDWKEIAELTFT